MRYITIATVYLANDLEALLLELEMQVRTVEYASFIEFIHDQEQHL